MRKALALGTVALCLTGLAATAAPASAADVTTTFAVAAGTLSVASAATTANLGTSTSSPLGTTVTGLLPKVTVTDSRGSLLGWTGSVASTAFTATVNATTQTIAASKAKAYIVVTNGPTLVSGTAVPATTAIDPATGKVLGAAQSFVTATTAGSNAVDYTPTVQVTIDSTVVAATYSGTITHTVV
jgi:hypothetical protein